jgi:hypothetical protein
MIFVGKRKRQSWKANTWLADLARTWDDWPADAAAMRILVCPMMLGLQLILCCLRTADKWYPLRFLICFPPQIDVAAKELPETRRNKTADPPLTDEKVLSVTNSVLHEVRHLPHLELTAFFRLLCSRDLTL